MNMEPKIYRMNPAQKEQVVETLKNALSAIEEVRFAFLFGSFSDDGEKGLLSFHDIDIGVFLQGTGTGEKKEREKKAVYYGLELSEQLSSLVRLPVDARVINFAPVTFLFHVVRGRLLVDKDEDTRCTFMEWVVRHYLDMKPLLHRAIKEAYG